MLCKKSCQRCYQKHEWIWDEDSWKDGYVSCPTDAITVYSDKAKTKISNSSEAKLLKHIFGLIKTNEDRPKWCI